MALGGSNDIDIKIRVDDQGAITILDALGNKVSEAGKKADEAKGGFSKFEANIITINQAAELAQKGFELLFGGFEKVFELAKRGDEIGDVSDAFERMAIQAGVTASALTDKLAAATEETISSFDLMKSANDAMLAGLDPDAVVTLAEAGKKLADAYGKDAKQAIDALTQSVETGKTGQLKQYGIIVDSTYVINKYANAHRMLAEDVDETTKVHLIADQALKQIQDKLASLPSTTKSAGDAAATMAANYENLKNAFAVAISNSVVLREVFQELTEVIKAGISVLMEFDRNLSLLSSPKGAAGLNAMFAEATASLVKGVQALPGIGKLLISDQDVADLTQKADRASAKVFELSLAELGLGKSLDKVSGQTKVNIKTKEELAKEAKDARDAANVEAKGQENLKKSIKETNEQLEQYKEELKKVKTFSGQLQAQNAFGQLVKDGQELGLTADQINTELQKQIQHWKDVGLSAAEANQLAIDGMQRVIDKNKEVIDKTKGGFEPGKTGAGESIINAFGGDGKKYGAMGEQIGAAIMQGIQAAFSAKTGKDWQKAAGDLVGGISDAIIPGSGQFVAPITNAIVGLFIGHDSAATKARKQLDKWLGDLFEAHHIETIINGKLKEITNIEFFGGDFGNRDKGFFDSFDKLGAKAAGAFGAIGSAFAALMGQTQELAGNFAAALSTNMGGSLNNLQQLVAATGLTFSQFGDALWAAFNKGQLSAMQLEQELMNLRDLMTKGIPGAVGAVKQAWANMQVALDAGPKGAQALIDAIGDIAAEANDLRIKSLPALRAAMINNFGISAKAADDFFKALKVAGVNSFEDLKNASKETLLAIAANLEAIHKGLAATFGVVKDPTATPATTSGGSSHIGGSSSGQTKAEQEAERKKQAILDMRNAIDQLAKSTADYQTVLKGLNSGLLTSQDATAALLGFEAKAKLLYAAQQKAQKDLLAAEAKKSKEAIAKALLEVAQAEAEIKKFQEGNTGVKSSIENGQFLLPSSFNVKVDAGGLDVRDISAFVKNLNDLPLSKSFTLKVAVNGSSQDKKILQGVFNNNVGPGQVSR